MAKDKNELNLSALLAAIEESFRDRFLELVAILSSQEVIAELTALIEAGRFGEALIRAEQAAIALAPKWGEAYVLAGEEAMKWATGKLKVVVDFDAVNEDAVNQIREAKLRMIRELSDEARLTVRDILTRGITEGINPKEMALEIREHIGLTQHQSQAVANYKKLLEKNSAEALQRQLRDARFDPSVRRALASDTPLSAKQIEKMVERYRQRMLDYRARTIARTEAGDAVSAGSEQAFKQLIDQGVIDPSEVLRTWLAGDPPRTRDWHHSMNRQQRGWGDPFRSGLGTAIMRPRAGNLPGNERINCRCEVTYRLRNPIAEGLPAA